MSFLEIAVLTYVVTGLLIVGGLWHFYEARYVRPYAALQQERVFRCVRCRSLYRARAPRRHVVRPCPDCGFDNDPLSI